MGGKINAHNILVGKTKGRRQFGRTRSRWEDIITLYPKEIEWGHDLDVKFRIVSGSWKHGTELPGLLKCWEFHNCLSNY
jgi:hypothetical protein